MLNVFAHNWQKRNAKYDKNSIGLEDKIKMALAMNGYALFNSIEVIYFLDNKVDIKLFIINFVNIKKKKTFWIEKCIYDENVVFVQRYF